jgi:hypothetical protein
VLRRRKNKAPQPQASRPPRVPVSVLLDVPLLLFAMLQLLLALLLFVLLLLVLLPLAVLALHTLSPHSHMRPIPDALAM